MKPPKNSRESAGAIEPFVALIRVAQEDAETRDRLLRILSLDPFHRHSALKTLIEDMRLKGAPAVLLSALSNLLDDAVSEKTREILEP